MGLGACQPASEPTSAGSAPSSAPQLELEHAGCEVLRGDLCSTTATVTLGARTDTDAELALSGVDATSSESWDGGQRWALAPSSKTRHVVVRACRGERCTERGLHVEPPGPELEAALRADLDTMLAQTESATATVERCVVLGRAGRRAIGTDPEAAIERLQAAAACAEAAELPVEMVRARVVASFILQRQGLFSEAERQLQAAMRAELGSLRRFVDYHLGLSSRDRGDRSAALEAWDRSIRLARRLNDVRAIVNAQQAAIPVLIEAGQFDEALERAREILARADRLPPEERAQVWTNVAWSSLLDGERRRPFDAFDELGPLQPEWPDPVPLQTEANRLHEAAGRAGRVANGRLNLALAAIQQDRLQAAAEQLDAVDPTALTAAQAPWFLDLQARLALARGRADRALARYRAMAAGAQDLPDIAWRAAVGHGRALEQLGRSEAALAAYEQAERILDREMLSFGVGLGRLGFLAQRDVSSRLGFELAVQRDRPDRARDFAQGAIGRAWASLRLQGGVQALSPERRAAWTRALERYRALREQLTQTRRGEPPAAELSTPRADRSGANAGGPRRRELVEATHAALRDALDVVSVGSQRTGPRPVGPDDLRVTYFPGRRRWYAVTETSTGVAISDLGQWRPAPGTSVDVQARRLIHPFKRALQGKQRLEVVAHPWLQSVDVHALPLDGQPLVASHEVRYALGVQSRPPVRSPSNDRPRRVVVVADPRGDLPHARAEGAAVADVYQNRVDVEVELLVGSDASVSRVLAELAGSDLFHYAGHARFDASGLESGLELAEGTRLTAADVLSLDRAPRQVVLSGCETSALERGGRAADVGLAHAFVLRGADMVAAAQRIVADELAIEVSRALHAAPDRLPGGLREVQRRLALERPSADWAAFRVFVP